MTEPAARAATAHDPGLGGMQMLIGAGPARFVADQPLESGGLDLGPTPHELVSAGLAACVAQTLRLYATRKGWPVGAVDVAVTHAVDPDLAPHDTFQVTVSVAGELAAEQIARLGQIADNCPVHRML